MSTSRPSRRVLLAGAAGGLAAGTVVDRASTASALSRQPDGRSHDRGSVVYVGSRTTEQRRARGTGITAWRIGDRSPRWELMQTVPADNGTGRANDGSAAVIPGNPSYLILNARQDHLYVVHGDDTKVSVLAVDKGTGGLEVEQVVDIGRRNPVHLSIDPSGRWLVVATLAAPGAVLTLRIGADGRLGEVASVLELPGEVGPHRTAQVGPNPHHVVFDPSGRWLLIPDRGLDRLFVAALDARSGRLRLNDPGWAQVREVEGPRHVAFDEANRRVYLIGELRSTVTVFSWDPRRGSLSPLQVVPSQPPTFTADTRAAAIVLTPGGRYLFASNRSGAGDETAGGPGDDTIGVYMVDRRTGALSDPSWLSTHGIRPRFVGLSPSGRSLFAANERSDSIVGFDLGASGRPRHDNGVVARTGSPVCIVHLR